MAKIYIKKALQTPEITPKKEIISFLLNYSKALNFLKVGDIKIEIILN